MDIHRLYHELENTFAQTFTNLSIYLRERVGREIRKKNDKKNCRLKITTGRQAGRYTAHTHIYTDLCDRYLDTYVKGMRTKSSPHKLFGF